MRRSLRRLLETALFSAAAVTLGVPACEPLDGCEYTATCPEENGGGASGSAPANAAGDAGTPNGAVGGTSSGNTSGSAGAESIGAAAGAPSGGSNGGEANGGGYGGSDATGNDGGAGGQGAAGAPPCAGGCAPPLAVCDISTDSCVQCAGDQHCSGEKPACDSETRECVACTQPAHCPPGLAACDTKTHTCVACIESSDCSGQTPVCDAMAHACVQCLESGDCAGKTPLCDTTENTCVECLEDPDCSTAAKARCVAGQCQPCTQDADCAHIPGKNVCNAGACVQCTEASASACGAHSCNPQLKRCTSTLLGSVGLCQTCVSDRECIGGNQADADARCVPMTFQGTVRTEAFCLRRSAKTCTRPFAQMPDAVASRSGATAERYCGVDPLTTRCEAVLDLIDARTCTNGQASACGCPRNADGACTALGSGALCGTVAGVANSCTYACGTVNDCPTGRACSIDQPYCH